MNDQQNSESPGNLPRGDLVERLLRLADIGPDIPADGADRIKTAIRPLWRRELHRRSRRRIGWAAAGLAAAVIVVIGLTFVLRHGRRAPADLGPVATFEVVRGEVEVTPPFGESRLLTSVPTLKTVAGESWILTDEHSRTTLRLSGGQSLRLDTNTRVRLDSALVATLDHGAVYLDSEDGDNDVVEVRTQQAAVREIGTQFEVRYEAERLLVKVRDGAVTVSHAERHVQVPEGSSVTVTADGSLERAPVPAFADDWDWVQRVAPPFDIEGRTVTAFLDWVSRETGLRIEFSDQEVAKFASETVLHGTAGDLIPAETPPVVLASCGLTADREADALVVARVDN